MSLRVAGRYPQSARFPPELCGERPGRVSGEGPERSSDHGDLLVVIPIGFPFGRFLDQNLLTSARSAERRAPNCTVRRMDDSLHPATRPCEILDEGLFAEILGPLCVGRIVDAMTRDQ
jgi:hypothetical protein